MRSRELKGKNKEGWWFFLQMCITSVWFTIWAKNGKIVHKMLNFRLILHSFYTKYNIIAAEDMRGNSTQSKVRHFEGYKVISPQNFFQQFLQFIAQLWSNLHLFNFFSPLCLFILSSIVILPVTVVALIASRFSK